MGGQGMIGAAGIVACTLTGILAEEHASCIDYPGCKFVVIFGLYNQVLWGVCIGEVDSLLQILDEYEAAVVEGFDSDLLTRQLLKLAVEFCLHIENELFGVGNQQHLRVDTVFGL